MTLSPRFIPPRTLLLAALLGLTGCTGSTGDGGDLSPPGTCEEVCAISEASCVRHDEDCLQLCRTRAASAAHVSCEAAHASLTGCEAAHADLCSPSVVQDICEPELELYRSCLRDACRDDPTSSFCQQVCRSQCWTVDRCPYAGDCTDACDFPSEVDANCRAQAWDLIVCRNFEMQNQACAADACAAEAEAEVRCRQGQPSSVLAVMYESCAERTCASGECLSVQTSRTAGSMCTASCTDDVYGCPGGGHCVFNPSGSSAICLPPCQGDGDCGAGNVCTTLDYLIGHVDHTTYCTPDA